jgi:hypothetical protein
MKAIPEYGPIRVALDVTGMSSGAQKLVGLFGALDKAVVKYFQTKSS